MLNRAGDATADVTRTRQVIRLRNRPPRGLRARHVGLAIPVGAVAGLLVWLLEIFASYLQFLAYGAAARRLASPAADLAWWSRLIRPPVGCAIATLLLLAGTSAGRGLRPPPYGLQDVIMNRRMPNTIQSSTLSLKDSFLSAADGLVSFGGEAARDAKNRLPILAPVSASCMAGCSGSTSTSAASSLRSVLRRLSPLRYIRRWLQSC